MKKSAVLFILLVTVSLSIYASDLTVKQYLDSDGKYITIPEAHDCLEIAFDGYTMPFLWTFYLTDEYAEFHFWWPDGRRMSAPGWKTEYTISVLTEDGRRYSFDGYTPDSYAIRIDGDSEYIDFRNCLYRNQGIISFQIVQHDYRSSLVHSPWHRYEMGSIDISGIEELFNDAFGKSLYFDREKDPSEWLIGISLGPSLTPFGNETNEANARFGIEVAYLPYKVGSFSLGARADVSVFQKNVVSDVFLFDMSASFYMSNYFFVNRGFSLRLEYGVGMGYIHNLNAIKYTADSFSIRIPVALSFIVNTRWNIGIDIMLDLIPAFGYDSRAVALAGGGVSFRYGF